MRKSYLGQQCIQILHEPHRIGDLNPQSDTEAWSVDDPVAMIRTSGK